MDNQVFYACNKQIISGNGGFTAFPEGQIVPFLCRSRAELLRAAFLIFCVSDSGKGALYLFIDERQIIFCVPGDVKIDLGIDTLGHGFY